MEIDFGDAPEPQAIAAPSFRLRDYQGTWKAAFDEARKTFNRMLVDAATGTGKTTFFAAVSKDEWTLRNGRSLILENRDALVKQTARRIADETGIEVEIEMAGSHASPFAPIVVASVMTLARDNRLLGFPDNHFSLIIPDEAHHSLANSWQKVLNYFHFGAESLDDKWVMPEPGDPYTPRATVLGVTATPDIGSKRDLGEFYQSVVAQYQYLQAVHDGWLVKPITKNIPLKIDIRGLRPGRTPNGSDFNAEELSQRLIPVLEALAEQISKQAPDRKGIVFVPSIECARLLAAAISRHGLRGIFVSGACLDVDEKTEQFRKSGGGTFLCNACLYVEGADFPDVNCVVPARATKSKGFYRQQIGRGTRVLPGTVDGLPTPELRKTAIANSEKPNLLILDPLWISDRIDLCDAYDLMTDKPEIKERMKDMPGVDMEEAVGRAERDFIKALEKEAKKHARKKERVIDPLAWALCMGDAALANYKPEVAWEMAPAEPSQLSFLRQQHVDTSKVTSKGLAQKLIGRFLSRVKMGLATPSQLQLLINFGMDEQTASTLTVREASSIIGQQIGARRKSA